MQKESGAQPGYLDRGFKFVKGQGSVLSVNPTILKIPHENEIIWTQMWCVCGGVGGGGGSSTLLNSLWIHLWGMAPIRSLKWVCTVCSELSVDHFNLKLSADNQSYRKSSVYWTDKTFCIQLPYTDKMVESTTLPYYTQWPGPNCHVFFIQLNLGIHIYRDACRYRCRNVQNPTVDRTCACICISTLYSNALKLNAESSMMYQ